MIRSIIINRRFFVSLVIWTWKRRSRQLVSWSCSWANI